MITELKINGKPTGLYAVDVPARFCNYRISIKNNLLCDIIDEDVPPFITELSKGEYQVLGPVTEHEIGFDCEPYVEKDYAIQATIKNPYLFRNYKCDVRYFELLTKEESFYSLLNANGLYFVNPIKIPEGMISNVKKFLKITEEWQSYQDLLVTKLLIIQKK